MQKIKKYIIDNKYILLTVGIIILLLSEIRNPDPDTYWHIKNGEWIVKNGIPNVDPFSYSHGNFISHEWLFDIISYIVFNYLGYIGMWIFCHAFLGITLLISYSLAAKKTNSMILPCVLSAILILSNSSVAVLRPSLISSFLIVLTIYLLENNKNIWIIPILSLLCINIHGGMTFIILLIFILYIFCNVYEKSIEINSKQFLYNIIVLISVIITLFITPYGIKCFTYGLTMPNYVTEKVTEFAPLIKNNKDIILLLTILIGPASMTFSGKKKLIDVLMTFMGLMMCLLWIRMLFLYSIIYIIYNAQYISDCFQEIKQHILKNHQLRFNMSKIVNTTILMLVFMLIPLYIVSISSANMVSDERTSKYGTDCAPQTILNYIEENHLDVTNNIMLNNYNFGGYFIFHDIPVFIDGRADIYIEEFGNQPIFKDYLNMIEYKDDETLNLYDKYNIKYIATYTRSSLPKKLIASGLAKELVSDNNVVLLEIINK